MRRFYDWLDSRTGVRRLLHEALFENVPGGSRWRYVWGSTLTFALVAQFLTGVVLWMAYSPSAQTAWESVYFIQHQLGGGWFLRGLHHFMAQLMTVLLALHLMQIVIDGAYRAPREINFWSGLALLLLVMATSLTGYLLPWDQKGYWATKVATNILAITPVFGEQLQQLVIGGSDYGHATLTRFFALHAGVLPGLMIAVVVGHIALFRKHGLTPAKPIRRRDEAFWPDQVLKDAVACLAVMATVVGLTLYFHGAPLSAPADPSEPFSAARPEWYFLFLFQFLKYFPGGTEIWGAIILPTLFLLVLAAMPFIAQWRLGHRFNLGYLAALLVGAGLLTALAWRQDANDPLHRAALADAEFRAARAIELAAAGIPVGGAAELLRRDPLIQGPPLFADNCASCHRYGGTDGLGGTPTNAPSAPDLKGFGSRAWLAGLLDPARVDSAEYFGGTKFREGKMVRFVKQKVAKYTPEQREQLAKVIAAVSAEAGLPAQAAADTQDAALIATGRALLRDEMSCTDCHQFHKPDEDATAPDLTGWGSREWLVAIISNPAHPRFYGKRNDRMPAFLATGQLDPESIGLLADWLRGDWLGATNKLTVSRR